ncbi:transglycosylase SLT domain-containing protein [Amycolatopsis sp. H20-H5]|uniref:transglycosylase SLT domain-containing protein n=1 Tax=Amycolatopsis sp. H20-H5 TaxID=3046309 RepID=UPI002DBA01E6|nr:transglycosylase SLT domain-containing protein [Amycolatopsis sp. H20-H5]MEC3976713.1 transglycosylase SLT domain-containing protein [Amycolatopsis sp. H20-H5]
MSKLSPEQIARHAYDAGFRGQGLTTAVAVALAESGGDTRAHNATPPDNSYGLWQINMLGGMGPERREQYHLDSNSDLFEPAANAKVANSLSADGKSWAPWSTYTNGAYRKHLTAARKAAHEIAAGHGKHPAVTPKGGGGAGRLRVDSATLDRYVKRSRQVADALGEVAAKQVKGVRGLADDSFGRIGKESGFADALGDFGLALQKQVKGVGATADSLASAAARASKSYTEHEAAAAAHLRDPA